MHDAAYAYVERTLAKLPRRKSVIEVGSRDINGGVAHLLGKAAYTGIDLYEGEGVDVVGDALEYAPEKPVDTVICCEVLEHADDPAALCRKAHEWLVPGGYFILTAAGVGRPKHSGIDGGALREGESYQEVAEKDLARWLRAFADVEIETNAAARDIYALARKAKANPKR